jgi:hypothetical protein
MSNGHMYSCPDDIRTQRFAHLIANKTNGNPFFVIEIIRSLYQRGMFDQLSMSFVHLLIISTHPWRIVLTMFRYPQFRCITGSMDMGRR